MNVASVIALLQVVAQALSGAITTAEQLVDLGSKFMKTINGTDPTPEDIAALRAAIDADVAQALTPLPPAQPGDPDFTS